MKPENRCRHASAAPSQPERPDDTWLREGNNGDVADWCAWAEQQLSTLQQQLEASSAAWVSHRADQDCPCGACEDARQLARENHQLQQQIDTLTKALERTTIRDNSQAEQPSASQPASQPRNPLHAPTAAADICKCGHYRSMHIDGQCRGWMPGGVAWRGDRCPCVGFVLFAAISHNDDYERLVEQLLAQIDTLTKEKHGAYSERNQLVALLSKLWPSHLAQHPDDPAWDPEWLTIVCIHAPFGQLSWHIKTSERPLFEHLSEAANDWDGHTTDEKYARIAAYRRHHQEEPGS